MHDIGCIVHIINLMLLMKFIWIGLLAWTTPLLLFAQKPLIQQKSYNWNQEWHAAISDRGGYVLTEGAPGLYMYNTRTGNSLLYVNAFNGAVSSNENLIVFQKPKDTVGILDTRGKRLVYVDSVAGFRVLNAGVLVQKVNGGLYYYESFVEQRKKFDDARKKMDQAKADVREAKTTTAIEKKAICYQLTVDDFDQQTEELIKIIEALPKIKQGYVKDIFVVLTKHKQYHSDMSKFFAASVM